MYIYIAGGILTKKQQQQRKLIVLHIATAISKDE